LQEGAPSVKPEQTGLRRRWPGLIAGLLLVGMLLGLRCPELASSWQVNQAALATVRGLVASGVPLAVAEHLLASPPLAGNCRALWLRGLVAHAEGHQSDRDEAWAEWLRCPEAQVAFLEVFLEEDVHWAERSVRLAPQDAESWFWLARLRAATDPDEAIVLYRQGLERNPFDALRWRELGDLLVNRDPEAAIQAYLNSCIYGDPGSNGCYRAGKTAERLGDLERAARYYRLSRNEGIRQMAVEIERQWQARRANKTK
jgi:tetratricopeptide (TPR) repeat protein